MINQSLKIIDDSGFIAMVNPDKYNSFVSADWDFAQLSQRFVDEMNKETLIIWATGMEGEWNVQLLENPSGKSAFREFEKVIEVTNGQLCFTNYEDLSMAAQFKDFQITAEQNPDRLILINNGKYKIIVKQLFNPGNFNIPPEDIHFEIIFKPTAMNTTWHNINKIFWHN